MADTTELGHVARVIIVQLEQVAHKRGNMLIPPVAREMRSCETAVKPLLVEGLTELVARGLAESHMPGCRDRTLAIFAPPLDREYRLTSRGHTWKCNALRSVNTQVHRLLGH